MRELLKRTLIVGCLGLPMTHAATITKADNTTDLNLGGSWVGGTATGAADIGLWDATVIGANTASTGASTLDWNGIRITNPGGDVTINGPGYLRIGSGGVDMSSATRNLSIANFDTNANNTWNVATGRSLTISQYFRDGGQVSLAGGGSITYGGSGAGTGGGALRLGGDNSGFTGTFTQTASTTTYFENGTAGSANAQWTFNGAFLAPNTTGTFRFGALSGSATVFANAAATLEVGALGLDTTYSGGIQTGGGQPITLNKVGPGRLTLTAANTWSGGTSVSAGTLAIQSGSFNALNQTTAITVGAGASLTANQTANNAHNIGALTLNGGTLTSVNGPGGTANDGGFGNWLLKGVTVGGTGLATISPTTLAIVSGTFNVGDSVAGTGNDLLVSGRILSGALTKEGAGTMTLNSENTFAGGTIVNTGTLVLADPTNNNTGTVRGTVTVNNGATLRLDTANALGWGSGLKVNTLNINGGLVDNVAAGDNGWGLAINFGANAGTLRSNGGTSSAVTSQLYSLGGGSSVSTSAAATGSAVMAGRLNLREDLTFTVNDGSAPVDLSVTAAITQQDGARTLIKSGLGTMSLSGQTSHSGGTTVNAGTLQLLAGFNLLNTTAPVTIGAGAILTANAAANNAHNIGALALNGGTLTSINGPGGTANDGGFGNWLLRGVTVGGTGLSTISPTTLAIVSGAFNVGDAVAGAGTDLLVSAQILSGAFIKTGVGTLELTAASPTVGKVTVNDGTLLITSESNLGANPGAYQADQLRLSGGTLRVTGTLALDDSNRGLAIGPASPIVPVPFGTLQVDAGTLSIPNPISGANGNLRKSGAGTFNLTASATVNGLVVDAGKYVQSAGITTVTSTSTGFQVGAGAEYELAGGTLRADAITIDPTGTFTWGAGRLTVSSTQGSAGTTDFSNPGYTEVRSGTTLAVQGNLATGTSSVLQLHGSPTFYLNNGLRFQNLLVNGDLNLAAADSLTVEITPYLLRPFSPSLGTGAEDFGSVPLVAVTGGDLTGVFNTFVGVSNDGRGFDPFTGSFTSAAALDLNTWYLEYATNVVDPSGFAPGTYDMVIFHYRVNGYVPEPGTFGLMSLGALLLRNLRRRAAPQAA